MNKPKSAANPISLGRPESTSPQNPMLQGVHENFARALGTSLSTFLQAEIQANVAQISALPAGEFHKKLRAPACLIRLRLTPREECIVMHLSPALVFGLLELLLGGSGAGEPEVRALTEIEWSLLEEVVRVMLRSLGEAWQVFHAVDFKVESLESDPAMLPAGDPAQTMVWIRMAVHFGEEIGEVAIVAPQTFFESAIPMISVKEPPQIAPPDEDVRRNLSLLEEASVDLEVSLDGPTMEFRELMALKPGQVVRFNYPLRKAVQARINGSLLLTGHVVSAGRKRAFQIEQLPN